MAIDSQDGQAGGGGVGSGPQPGSAIGGSGSGGGNAGGVNNPSLSSTPQIVELTDDSMVKLPGAKDPVRYGDHYRTFQSEFTKRAQEAARAKQELGKLQGQIQDYRRRMQSQQQQGQGQPPSTAARMKELGDSLKSLTYLNGTDAARVVEQLTQQFVASEQALSQRDLALGLMYKKMQQMAQTVNQLHGRHSSTEFEGKINNFVAQGGLPKEATEFAKELYLAYEGDDLDQEFPKILKQRWEQLAGIYKSSEKKRLDEARRQPFVPGKGGNGTPSRPLQNLAKASAKEIADAIWPGAVDGEVET